MTSTKTVAEIKEGDKVVKLTITKDRFHKDLSFAYFVFVVKGCEVLNGHTAVQSVANTDALISYLDSLIIELDFSVKAVAEICEKIKSDDNLFSHLFAFGLNTDKLTEYEISLVDYEEDCL